MRKAPPGEALGKTVPAKWGQRPHIPFTHGTPPHFTGQPGPPHPPRTSPTRPGPTPPGTQVRTV